MDARVQRTIDMMHRRVTDQVSIARLSAEVGLSSGRLRHLFRQETGQSLMRYSVGSGNFGQATSMLSQGYGDTALNSLYQIGGPRSIQLAMKLQF